MLSPLQHDTLRSAMNRLIPADEFPSASDAGVGDFIDRLFETYLREKFDSFAAGLDSLALEAKAMDGRDFSQLNDDEADALLSRIECGAVTVAWSTDAIDFFRTLLDLTAEGYFSDPSNGGNKNQIAWKMVGYDPGANNIIITSR